MMYDLRSKTLFFASGLAVLILFSGCGLNERSAATDPPVIVQPIQNGDEQGDGATNNNNEGDAGTNTDQQQNQDQVNTDGGTDQTAGDQNQQDQGASDANNDQAQEETPREEQPQATEVPADPQPTEAPAQPEPTVAPTAVPPSSGARTHIVTAGQTLFTIAQSYGLTVSELAAANGIVDPNRLSVGEQLAVPVPGSVVLPETASVHIVRYGDTMFNIAQRYGLTVDELALFNNIANINRIDIGQEIRIPTQ